MAERGLKEPFRGFRAAIWGHEGVQVVSSRKKKNREKVGELEGKGNTITGCMKKAS
jgi:ribosomal protein L34